MSELNKRLDTVAKKEDLVEVLNVLKDHDERLLSVEGMKGDMKNVIDLAAQFGRWKEKVYKICAVGFLIMVAKSVGIPDWVIKILAAMGGA